MAKPNRKRKGKQIRRIGEIDQRMPWSSLTILFPLAALVFFQLYWNWRETFAFAERYPGVGSWLQAVGTVGAIVAAIMMPVWERRRRIKHDQTIAAMRVAEELRSWMRKCASVVGETIHHTETQGNFGHWSIIIPPFNFEKEQVASMSVGHAKTIYSIVEQYERAISSVEGARRYNDDDVGETEFLKESAKLFRRCRWRYIRIAKETGLHPYTSQSWEIDAINKAAEMGGVKNWKDLAG